jgi:hypothetical protein
MLENSAQHGCEKKIDYHRHLAYSMQIILSIFNLDISDKLKRSQKQTERR